MEDLNLVVLLKDAPRGARLYSPVFGECEFEEVVTPDKITVRSVIDKMVAQFTEKGHYYSDRYGECLLFPSRENRDWSNFKVDNKGFSKGDYVRSKNNGGCFKIINISENLGIYSIVELVSDRKIQGDLTFSRDNFINGFEKIRKFDKRCFRPFDRVLVRDRNTLYWQLDIFSHIDDSSEFEFVTINVEGYRHCVPYNSETADLLNTVDYAPEFYEEKCDY